MTGRELDAALAALHWSRRQAASALGCSPALVDRWASGGAPVPCAVGRWLRALVRAWVAHPAPYWRVRVPRAPLEAADRVPAAAPRVVSVPEDEDVGGDGDVPEGAEHDDGDGGSGGVGADGDGVEPIICPVAPS